MIVIHMEKKIKIKNCKCNSQPSFCEHLTQLLLPQRANKSQNVQFLMKLLAIGRQTVFSSPELRSRASHRCCKGWDCFLSLSLTILSSVPAVESGARLARAETISQKHPSDGFVLLGRGHLRTSRWWTLVCRAETSSADWTQQSSFTPWCLATFTHPSAVCQHGFYFVSYDAMEDAAERPSVAWAWN